MDIIDAKSVCMDTIYDGLSIEYGLCGICGLLLSKDNNVCNCPNKATFDPETFDITGKSKNNVWLVDSKYNVIPSPDKTLASMSSKVVDTPFDYSSMYTNLTPRVIEIRSNDTLIGIINCSNSKVVSSCDFNGIEFDTKGDTPFPIKYVKRTLENVGIVGLPIRKDEHIIVETHLSDFLVLQGYINVYVPTDYEIIDKKIIASGLTKLTNVTLTN